jgi:anti-sigma factor RsiW
MTYKDPNQELEAMRKLLKRAVPTLIDSEPRRDLWPQVLRRLETPPARVPWWDWVLLAGSIAAICAFPNILPALLFHL